MNTGGKMRKFLSWAVRALVATLPFAGEKIKNVPPIWPPLGSIETYGAGVATALFLLFGAAPKLFKNKAQAKAATYAASGLAAISLVVYGGLLSRYVVGVETPKDGTQYRTVGEQRSREAIEKFPALSDAELLHKAGLEDADIERMWTRASLHQARIE